MAGRSSKRMRRRQRGRFGALYRLLSAILIIAAIVAACTVFFRVSHIEVEGTNRYTAQEIIDATGIEMRENLFLINKNQAVIQVKNQLPYVDEISIRRQLPDTLVITISESTPVAALSYDGEWWLLDAGAKLLERGDQSIAAGHAQLLGLIPLSPAVGKPLAVDETESRRLDALKELLSSLKDYGLAEQLTDFIDCSADNAIRFGWNGTLTVEMPLSDFQQQSWRLSRALEELQAKLGTVSGTLTLPAEGDRAWLKSERWFPTGYIALPDPPAETPSEEGGEGTASPEVTAPASPSVPAVSVAPEEPGIAPVEPDEASEP